MVNKNKASPRPKPVAKAKTSPRPEPVDSEAALQARLVEAQAAMERDYARLREFESRYRHLFVATTEALLLVDAQTLRALDANPAACALLGLGSQRVVGASMLAVFHARGHAALESMAAEMRRGGQAGNLRVDSAVGARRLLVSASLFRQDGAFVLLLRLDPADARPPRGERGDAGEEWARYCAVAPDALVLTDLAGKVLQTNAAFAELVQVATERQIRGESLGRWLGRTSVAMADVPLHAMRG